ncbi:unannotated protein [freshwater metagenome]|uniref:Unannotated protein n=1 Tax=freshwater metagenome TaxID=449393 RepID=A0A6J6IUT1_9ZZZZ
MSDLGGEQPLRDHPERLAAMGQHGIRNRSHETHRTAAVHEAHTSLSHESTQLCCDGLVPGVIARLGAAIDTK